MTYGLGEVYRMVNTNHLRLVNEPNILVKINQITHGLGQVYRMVNGHRLVEFAFLVWEVNILGGSFALSLWIQIIIYKLKLFEMCTSESTHKVA